MMRWFVFRKNGKSEHPLIDMQGNNGSIDDDPAAAMRYTEARLAPIEVTIIRILIKIQY